MAITPVTDPDLLKKLNSGDSSSQSTGQPVTDPATLAILNGDTAAAPATPVTAPPLQQFTADTIPSHTPRPVATPSLVKFAPVSGSSQDVMGIATPRQQEEAKAVREIITGAPVKRGKYVTPELRNAPPRNAFEQGIDAIRSALSPYDSDAMNPAEIAAAQISMEAAQQKVPAKTFEINGQNVTLPARAMSRNEYIDVVNPKGQGVRTLERFMAGVPQGAKSIVTGTLGAAQALGSDTAKNAANALQADTLNTPIDDSFAGELGSGFGSLLTFLIPSMGVQKAAFLISTISPAAARLAATGTMTAFEAATEGGSVYRDMLGKGYSDADASAAAAKTFIANLPVNFITDKAAFFPEHSASTAVKRAINSATTEGVQEGAQEYISSRSQPGKVDIDDIIKSAAIGALTGAGTGAVQHQIQKNAPQQIPDFTDGMEFVPPTVPPGVDPARADKLAAIMAADTPEAAAARLAAMQQPRTFEPAPDQPVNWGEYGVEFDQNGEPVEPVEAAGQPVTDPGTLAVLNSEPLIDKLDFTSNGQPFRPEQLNFEIGLMKNPNTSKTAVLIPQNAGMTAQQVKQLATQNGFRALKQGEEFYIYDPKQIPESTLRGQIKAGKNGQALGYGTDGVPENGIPYAVDLDGHGTVSPEEIIALRDAGQLGFAGMAPDMASAVEKIREMGRDDAAVRGGDALADQLRQREESQAATNAWEAAQQEVDVIRPTVTTGDISKAMNQHIVMDAQPMSGGQPVKLAAPYDGTEADAMRVAKALKLYASEEHNASMRDSAVFATDQNGQPRFAFTQGEGVTEIHTIPTPAPSS